MNPSSRFVPLIWFGALLTSYFGLCSAFLNNDIDSVAPFSIPAHIIVGTSLIVWAYLDRAKHRAPKLVAICGTWYLLSGFHASAKQIAIANLIVGLFLVIWASYETYCAVKQPAPAK